MVDAGSTAQFNCSVSGGVGMVHVTWLKDGRPVGALGDRERVRVGQLGGQQQQGGQGLGLGQLHTLEVRHLERGDRGMYQCVARSADESTQAGAELELGGEYESRTRPQPTP